MLHFESHRVIFMVFSWKENATAIVDLDFQVLYCQKAATKSTKAQGNMQSKGSIYLLTEEVVRWSSLSLGSLPLHSKRHFSGVKVNWLLRCQQRVWGFNCTSARAKVLLCTCLNTLLESQVCVCACVCAQLWVLLPLCVRWPVSPALLSQLPF